MEAELIKENIVTSYPSANLTLNIIAEGETIVPDTKKDILKILYTESRCCIEKTEIQNGRVIFTGNAEFTVLYVPESGGIVSSVTSRVPFNHIEECENVTSEDKFNLTANTIHAECTLLNSRKISLKTLIGVNFTSYTDVTVPVVSRIRHSDMEVKLTETTFTHISSSISECFTVSDFLDFPASEPPLDTLLLCRTFINDCSLKAVTGKAVIKGTLSVFQLYLSAEGRVSHMKHDIPFTEISDIPGLSEDSKYDINFFVKDYSITPDSSASNLRFTFSAEISISATVFENATYTVTEDAYIPGTDVKINFSEYKKSIINKQNLLPLTLKETISLPSDMPPIGQLFPLSCKISSIGYFAKDGKIKINGTIDISIIYLSSDGDEINTFVHELSFSEECDCPSDNFDINIRGDITHSDYNFINQSKLDLRCILTLCLTFFESTSSFPCISSVTIGDSIPKKRPSIVIYFVKSGDNLWNIAKKYHTTEDKILSANALDKGEILNSGMRLLIPS